MIMKNGVYWIRFKESVKIVIDEEYNDILNFEKGDRTIISKTDDGIYLGTEGQMIEDEVKGKYEIISENLEEEIQDEIIHNRELRFWINDDETYEYSGENLKPSQIITMGAILQRDGLCEFEISERNWKIHENEDKEEKE